MTFNQMIISRRSLSTVPYREDDRKEIKLNEVMSKEVTQERE